jgi:hypothetical protein
MFQLTKAIATAVRIPSSEARVRIALYLRPCAFQNLSISPYCLVQASPGQNDYILARWQFENTKIEAWHFGDGSHSPLVDYHANVKSSEPDGPFALSDPTDCRVIGG